MKDEMLQAKPSCAIYNDMFSFFYYYILTKICEHLFTLNSFYFPSTVSLA